MRLSSELYKGVLEELDKVNSPSFPLSSFLHFFNRARLEYCNTRYTLFEQTQQLTDDLQAMSRKITSTTNSINLTSVGLINPLPAITVDLEAVTNGSSFSQALGEITAYNASSNYMHALLGVVSYTFTANYKCFKAGQVARYPVKRLTDDKRGFILDNSYFMPKWYRPYFKIENNVVYLVNGETVDLPPVTLEFELTYLKHPKLVVLGMAANGTIAAGWDILSEFVEYVDNETMKICVKLFLENIEQKRLQTNIPVNPQIP